jgi:hypothetical protein
MTLMIQASIWKVFDLHVKFLFPCSKKVLDASPSSFLFDSWISPEYLVQLIIFLIRMSLEEVA